MELNDILAEAQDKINGCEDINTLLHDVKSSIFGKNSELTKIFATMKDLTQEAKKELGQRINIVKQEIETVLEQKREELEQRELEKKLQSDTLDGTLSCRQTPKGGMHLITKTEAELCEIFTKYGFTLADGFEIE